MINFIAQTVSNAFNEHEVSFVRDAEKSAQFAPVFIVKVGETPLIRFNSALLNEKSEKHSLAEVVNATIIGLITQIQNHIISLQQQPTQA